MDKERAYVVSAHFRIKSSLEETVVSNDGRYAENEKSVRSICPPSDYVIPFAGERGF